MSVCSMSDSSCSASVSDAASEAGSARFDVAAFAYDSGGMDVDVDGGVSLSSTVDVRSVAPMPHSQPLHKGYPPPSPARPVKLETGPEPSLDATLPYVPPLQEGMQLDAAESEQDSMFGLAKLEGEFDAEFRMFTNSDVYFGAT